MKRKTYLASRRKVQWFGKEQEREQKQAAVDHKCKMVLYAALGENELFCCEICGRYESN